MVKYNFVVSLIHSTMLNLDRIYIRIFNLSYSYRKWLLLCHGVLKNKQIKMSCHSEFKKFIWQFLAIFTAWKLWTFGVFWSVFSPKRESREQKNSEYGHFLRSAYCPSIWKSSFISILRKCFRISSLNGLGDGYKWRVIYLQIFQVRKLRGISALIWHSLFVFEIF